MLVSKLLYTKATTLRSFSTLPSRLFQVGDILRETQIFSSEDVLKYSQVSQDINPLHFDSDFAQNAGFEDRLVHGMLVAALFPRIIASHFPGAVYVSQSLHFRSPVYIGEEVVASVEATALRENKNRYIAKFSTKCLKNGEVVVLDGEATAILPSLST